jgi:hypothetical protein
MNVCKISEISEQVNKAAKTVTRYSKPNPVIYFVFLFVQNRFSLANTKGIRALLIV